MPLCRSISSRRRAGFPFRRAGPSWTSSCRACGHSSHGSPWIAEPNPYSYSLPPRLIVVFASVARALATIDVKDLARHEAGPLQVEDRVDDVGDLAQMANGFQGFELRICLGGMHRCLDVARRHRVHSDG